MSADLTDPNAELARAVEATRAHEQNSTLAAEIASLQERLSDATANVAMADTHIAELKRSLSGWDRFRAYQDKRTTILSRQVKLRREELRLNEDYEGLP